MLTTSDHNVLRHGNDIPHAHRNSKTNHLVLINELLEALSLWLRLATSLDRAKLVLCVLSSIWVETEQNLLVVERVLLLHRAALLHTATTCWSQDSLNLRGADEFGNIWLSDSGRWEEEVLLQR